MRGKSLITTIALLFATPAIAQQPDHNQHQMQSPQPDESEPADHGAMDHSKMDHSQHEMQPAPLNTVRPASSGPPQAADAIWGKEAMKASRRELYNAHGNMKVFWFQGDRLEYRAREDKDGYLWDVQGYYGGDIGKFWFKSEGEGSFGEAIEQAEVQALYSHAIAPFFDVQVGVRQDLHGPERTHLAVGVQGLTPYMFEIDAAAFLSNKEDFTARIEAEYDHRLTQKLILQPRAELNLSAQDIPELGIGAGIDNVELGLRLRYEIIPEFAPYVGVEQEWKTGNSRSFSIAAGEDASVTNYVIGVRFWF